ncbi:MAG: alpha-2-macroglobulin [Phycisphaerae bacterium]|nr:alpha-2-macroglobulin [Phycisphaerae bacterium]
MIPRTGTLIPILFCCSIISLHAQSPTPDTVKVVAVVPKTVYAGSPATISVTTLDVKSNEPMAAKVCVALQVGQSWLELWKGRTDEQGRATVGFDAPAVSEGSHTVQIEVEGVSVPLTAQVLFKEIPVLLIETDKPIYKPGQTIQGRVLVLSNQLQPRPRPLEVQVSDGKGVKVFRKSLEANAFGVAPFELPLANELNIGTWKITAQSGSASSCVDVRVEKYVLPRFKVELDTLRDYFLVNEEISGQVKVNYFFGRPVEGTVVIHASRYVATWEDYATYTAPITNGQIEFHIPPVGYVAGTQGAGGSGTVQLQVMATDTAGHEEKTDKILRIVNSTIQHQIIAETRAIVPDAPFQVTITAENQEGYSITVSAELACEYYDLNGQWLGQEKQSIPVLTGTTQVNLFAPEKTSRAVLTSTAKSNDATTRAELILYASWSPTDSFIYLSRSSRDPVHVGEMLMIDVLKTHDVTVYYDVFARGQTVWSGYSLSESIEFGVTPQMFPTAKIVAYIINPNNELSADSLEFDVELQDLAGLEVNFDKAQVLPGEPVKVSVKTDQQAMLGLAIVDESVYALNEGRLNMQEVFKELERLFMEPQVEEHPYEWNDGPGGVFEGANLQVLTSGAISVPAGRNIWKWERWLEDGNVIFAGAGNGDSDGLAEVTRIRQFFPETWLWLPDLTTDTFGTVQIDLTVPDSITTWRLHAVSTGDSGLGMSESSLRVFQEFFGEPDLPYAVTRGEQFPIRIQVYNYLDESQKVRVELAPADWFELLEAPVHEVEIAANSVGLASFLIQPSKVGKFPLEVTLRSPLRADAVRKEMLVEPEGTQREFVTNGLIKAGEKIPLDVSIPEFAVADSQKVLLSVTPSLVAQSINGVEDLLGMPYGCGEQNMIFLAPDIEVLRYLDATGQSTPEVRAKAEHFITTGYQRELTYRRQDGSFSAFGDSDNSGSLWLTAFVLDVFSGARDIMAIDDGVLSAAASWVAQHQKPGGFWEPVGFVHHQEMIGGLSGNFTLTAFVSIALLDYGHTSQTVIDKALTYLSGNLTCAWDDAYGLAIATLALTKAGSPAAQMGLDRLLELAISDAEGLHWEPHGVETTSYAALTLMEKELPQANEAIKWISLQQNGQGGFGSTQDTVMGLKALMTAARNQTRDIDLVIEARRPSEDGTGELLAQFQVDPDNFDVLQTSEIAGDGEIELTAVGSGETRLQLMRRFNVLLKDDCTQKDMRLDVDYDASQVAVNDIVNVTVKVRYLGLVGNSGMMIVDVGVPTGFEVLQDSLDSLVAANLISRVEVAGRKVIFYIDGLSSGQERALTFQVKARFPVRAVIPDSSAYLYYQPDILAESAGRSIVVNNAQVDVFEFFGRLQSLAENWLQQVPLGDAPDYNPDGFIDLYDYAVLAEQWLKKPQ